jgi:hypothetical protein
MMPRLFVLFTMIVAAVGPDAPAQTLAGFVSVHEGATLFTQTDQVRLTDIDAPEWR